MARNRETVRAISHNYMFCSATFHNPKAGLLKRPDRPLS